MKLKHDTDVLIVGGGPVGLFTALVLHECGLSTQIVDKEQRGSVRSYAAALHPGSLSLLSRYGLLPELEEVGHRVERIGVHDGNRRVGTMEFSHLDVEFPYVLVVPQATFEEILMRRLGSLGIEVFWEHQALGLDNGPDGVETRVGRLEKISKGYPVARADWIIAKELSVKSRFVVGADGYHSFVRQRMGFQFQKEGKTETFAVYEFSGEIGSPAEAQLVYKNGTVSVFWPLGVDRGRWSFQVPSDERPEGTLEAMHALAGERAQQCGVTGHQLHWTDSISFERLLVDRFGSERVWLAGDAAHVTGPVGAQSMNVGLREARDLALLIKSVESEGAKLETLDRYEQARRAEWTGLLHGIPRPVGHGPDGLAGRGARLLPCIPATGESMRELLGQVGYRLEESPQEVGHGN
jgi:2-polyprenyl-6-methoxyphenol hydroxylase-like FAD-dependent oxidoreductase